MKKMIIFTAFAISMLIFWFAWPRFQKKRREVVLPLSNIYKIGKTQLRDFSEIRPFFGKVESKNKVKIVSLLAGEIISVDAEDGAFVKKGNILFRLGGLRIDTRLTSDKKKIRRLRERIALVKSTISLKKDAVAQKLIRQDELTFAKDSLARLKSELALSIQQLHFSEESMRIVAPIDGIFTGRVVCVGQKIGEGEALVEIIAANQLRVVATLFSDAKLGLEGKKARVDTSKGEQLGAVVRELPKRLPTGATVIWIEGNGFADCLCPGETISGAITIALHEKALAVPESAIVRDDMERPYVFVKTRSDYQRRSVKIGMIVNGWAELISGITANNEVVIEGAYRLFYRDFNKIYQVED